MTEKEIIVEIERYLADTSYNYAVMIDGDWGCGKTYFVKNGLTESIDCFEQKKEKPRKVAYFSLYGTKTILDIQDAIAIQLHQLSDKGNKSFFGRLGKKRVVGKSVQSILTIAKAARDIYAPGASIFELEGIWRDFTSYIFIFDDVERCDCPLNEVFGFINGLVEHEGIKVILVANEKEIQFRETAEIKELQYLIATNEKIEYPKVKDFWGEQVEKNPLSPEELERRRAILFPQELIDDEFKKIREKLIGVTLHFQPNVKEICSALINEAVFSQEVKELLHCNLDHYHSEMINARHLNIRTFQFFLSRLKSILDSLSILTILPEYSEPVFRKILSDCFISAIDFKANIQPPEDRIARISFEISRENQSKAIDLYVRTGELQLKSLQEEIALFIDEKLVNNIPDNDPYKMLQHEYYLHPQAWCEEKIDEIQSKLKANAYPITAYYDIIRALLIMEVMEFEEKYAEEAKKTMIDNITTTDHPTVLEKQPYFFEGIPEIKERAKQVWSEIEDAIADHNVTEKKTSIGEILNRTDWIKGLTDYVEKNKLCESPDAAVFSGVKSNVWADKLKEASPETIWNFIILFRRLYPNNIIHQSMPRDVDVLMAVAKEFAPEKESDLIKKHLLKTLIKEIEKVFSLYCSSDQETTTD